MGKAADDLDKVGAAGGRAGAGVSGGMFEARQSLMLVEESVGVHVPRALNQLLARIPGVAQAFTTMLPIFGVVVAIEIIGQLIAKHEELAKATRAAAQASTDQAVKEADQTNALQLTNLKLDDQIAKLEHKPAHNYMAEAILEAASDMDKLAASFASDFAKMNEDIEAQLGWWNKLKGAVTDAFSVGTAAAIANAVVQDSALKKVQSSMAEVEEKRRQMAQAGGDYGTEYALVAALKAQQEALDRAIPAFTGNDEMLLKLKTSAASTASEIKDLGLQMEAAAKQKVIAGKEQFVANLEPLKDQAELYKIIAGASAKASEAIKATADANAKLTEDKTQGSGDPSQKYAAQHQYNEQILADAQDNAQRLKEIASGVYAHEYAANADSKTKQQQLTAQYNAQIADLSQSEATALNAFNEKELADYEAMLQKKQEMAVSIGKAQTTLAEAVAKNSLSDTLNGIAMEGAANAKERSLGLETEREFISQKIALANQEKDAKVAAIQEEIAAQQKQVDTAHGAGDQVAETEAMAKKIQLMTQLNQLTSQYGVEVKGLEGTLAQLNSSWTTYFAKMMVDTQDLSTQINGTLQKSVTQFEDQFSNSMAKCIVEGKNLGMAVRKEAEQMLEAMVSMLVKWLEQWIISHAMATLNGKISAEAQQMSAASLAGANMVASWAAAPWPLDAMAPAMGAEAYAAAMAYSAETGGVLPGTGPVPLLAHGGETIVTKALTDRVESAERNGGNGSDMHMHYSPQVHAMDAAGVDRVLQKHGAAFERTARDISRKRNK